MGTVLSLSPSYRKAVLFEDGPATVGHYTAVQNSKNAKDAATAAAKTLKRPSIINVLPWKRIVAVSAKRKGSKKLQSDIGDGGKGNSPEGHATAMAGLGSNSLKLKKSQSCANLSSYSSGEDHSATSTTTSSHLPTSKTLANVVTITAKKNSLTGSGIQPSTAAGTPKRVIVQVMFNPSSSFRRLFLEFFLSFISVKRENLSHITSQSIIHLFLLLLSFYNFYVNNREQR